MFKEYIFKDDIKNAGVFFNVLKNVLKSSSRLVLNMVLVI